MSAEGAGLILTALGVIAVNLFTIYLVYLRDIRSDRRLSQMEIVAQKTHDLVNSGSLELRRTLVVAMEGRAAATGNPEHIAEAEAAKELYEKHLAEQDKVDDTQFKIDSRRGKS